MLRKMRFLLPLFISAFLGATSAGNLAAQTDEKKGRQLLAKQAEELKSLVVSPIGKSFLEATANLPEIGTRVVYYNKEKKLALSELEAAQLDATSLENHQRMKFDEHFYYYTKYGTPLAFVRALDMVGQVGLKLTDNSKIVDFGFGSIGHLRMLASLGVEVTGIEVDPVLEALYSLPEDTGAIERTGSQRPGNLRLLFGRFPADEAISKSVGGSYDLFISKNTLKRGYIHPQRPADPKRLIQLGVDDETFVRQVYQRLRPGGFFMIYNLHPRQAPADKPYIPWADGRSPFSKEIYEAAGFKIITLDGDDTSFARRMGKVLGWQSQMDLKTDLFATYTLLMK